jgi:hypothetical protein
MRRVGRTAHAGKPTPVRRATSWAAAWPAMLARRTSAIFMVHGGVDVRVSRSCVSGWGRRFLAESRVFTQVDGGDSEKSFPGGTRRARYRERGRRDWPGHIREGDTDPVVQIGRTGRCKDSRWRNWLLACGIPEPIYFLDQTWEVGGGHPGDAGCPGRGAGCLGESYRREGGGRV